MLGIVAVAAILSACTTVSETGRSQFIMISDQEANQMGLSAYQKIKQQKKISRNPAYVNPVREVGNRVAAVSGRKYPWEFTVFEDKTPNAFALPGGKVGVHTGLFKVAKNKDQLAAVMAHEVAHATARHSAERISRDMVAQMGIGVLGGVTGTNVNALAQAATLRCDLALRPRSGIGGRSDRSDVYGACWVRSASGRSAVEKLCSDWRLASAGVYVDPSIPRLAHSEPSKDDAPSDAGISK